MDLLEGELRTSGVYYRFDSLAKELQMVKDKECSSSCKIVAALQDHVAAAILLSALTETGTQLVAQSTGPCGMTLAFLPNSTIH